MIFLRMLCAYQPCTPITTILLAWRYPRRCAKRVLPSSRYMRGIVCSCSLCKCGTDAPRSDCLGSSRGPRRAPGRRPLIRYLVCPHTPVRGSHTRGGRSNESSKWGSTVFSLRAGCIGASAPRDVSDMEEGDSVHRRHHVTPRRCGDPNRPWLITTWFWFRHSMRATFAYTHTLSCNSGPLPTECTLIPMFFSSAMLRTRASWAYTDTIACYSGP